MAKTSSKLQSEWQYLFDGTHLDLWDSYLGPPFKPGVEWVDAMSSKAIGLNNDPRNVFQIVDLEGERVIRISGEVWGALTTKSSFENYHLQLQFRWGEQKWFPRAHKKRDSGLLYHSHGEFGDQTLFWLPSQEFQIQEGDVGDYWGIGGASAEVFASIYESEVYQYNMNAEPLAFGLQRDLGRRCKKSINAEHPTGQWNTLELYCLNDQSWHVVNGASTMHLSTSTTFEKGKYLPLTSGKIQLQSEAAEVFYKEIKIRNLDREPEFV